MNTFVDFLHYALNVSKAILKQNNQVGNTCMPITYFAYKFRKYIEASDVEILNYLYFFRDYGIVMTKNSVGLKEDYEHDCFIRRNITLRKNRRSTNFRSLSNSRLSEEQVTAVTEAPKTDISIISGGAGTGKTTAINQIIRNFHTVAHKGKLFVLAPTGAAAKRDKETITEECEICTVHYFVGFGHPLQKRDYERIRSADFIIIDESSMLNASIFYTLLQLTDVPIVLVGDVNQLPAVEAGNILWDMIYLGVPVYYLRHNFRSVSEIVTNANIFTQDEFKDLNSSENFMLKKIKEEDITDILAHETSDIVLTPFRREDILGSCEAINNLIHEEKGYRKGYYSVGEPVVIMKTNKKRGYVNGETGHVIRVTENEIFVDLGNRTVAIKDDDDISLNYASTVHKAQGCEYPTVAIYCPDSPILTRNMLYTAITRAKSRVVIYYTDEAVFKHAFMRNGYKRNTFISEALENAA